MKSDNQKLRTGFKLLVLVFTFSFLVFNFIQVYAAPQPPAPKACTPGYYCLSVPIPVPGGAEKTAIKTPGEYIGVIYRFSLGIGALLAVALIVFGGIEYTVSAGNVSKQQEARDRILNAIYGLALLMGAVLILYTINPRLLNLKLPEVKPPPPTTDGASNTNTYQGARDRQRETRNIRIAAGDARFEWFKRHGLDHTQQAQTTEANPGPLPFAIWEQLAKRENLTSQQLLDLRVEYAKLNLAYFQAGQKDWEATLARELATLRSMPKPSEGLLETFGRSWGAWSTVQAISGIDLSSEATQAYQQQVRMVDRATAMVEAAKKNTAEAQAQLDMLTTPQGPQQ